MDNYNSLKLSADESMKNKNFEDAIMRYSLLINMNTENKNLILLNRCLAYLQVEKYNEALEDAKESLNLNPNNAKAWSRLGSCLLAKDKKDEAKIAFKKALELNPDNEEYKKLAEEEEDDDVELNDIMAKLKNLNFIKKLEEADKEKETRKTAIPLEAISELEKMIPLEGVMGNIFNKMMNNKNLLELMENNDFQKKITNYHKNPLEAIQDPQILGIMKDIMTELK